MERGEGGREREGEPLDSPTSVPTLLCRMATSMAWSVASLSGSRAGEMQAFSSTSVRQEFMSWGWEEGGKEGGRERKEGKGRE